MNLLWASYTVLEGRRLPLFYFILCPFGECRQWWGHFMMLRQEVMARWWEIPTKVTPTSHYFPVQKSILTFHWFSIFPGIVKIQDFLFLQSSLLCLPNSYVSKNFKRVLMGWVQNLNFRVMWRIYRCWCSYWGVELLDCSFWLSWKSTSNFSLIFFVCLFKRKGYRHRDGPAADACNSECWDKLKLRAWNSTWVSHMGDRDLVTLAITCSHQIMN